MEERVTKEQITYIVIAVMVFLALIVYWFYSPMYQEKIEAQWEQERVQFIAQAILLPEEERQTGMKYYDLTEQDLKIDLVISENSTASKKTSLMDLNPMVRFLLGYR